MPRRRRIYERKLKYSQKQKPDQTDDKNMNILDIILLTCFIAALVQGIRKGFIAQVIAIVSIIAGVWLSFRFSTIASQWLAQYVPASGQVLKTVAFALILIIVIFALGALGKLLEATIKIVMLGWLNRLLGALFSILKCALITGLIIMAFNALNNTFHIISDDTLYASAIYPPLKHFAYSVFPYLKDLLFWGR